MDTNFGVICNFNCFSGRWEGVRGVKLDTSCTLKIEGLVLECIKTRM
jgi:hypothetical protein